MKKGMRQLRTILLVLGLLLFVLATVGESLERAEWEPYGGYAEDIAKARGYKSYADVTEEALQEEIRLEAMVEAACNAVAMERGYKKFSKVKDGAEIEEIRTQAKALALAENESNFGTLLASVWRPLLILSILALLGCLALLILANRSQGTKKTVRYRQRISGMLKDQRMLLVLVIVAMVAVVGIINPKFVRLANVIAIFQQISVLGVLTMAQAMLLISGGIDLSMGNMMSLVGVTVATLLMKDQPLFIAVLGGMGVAVLCGLFNGIIIAKSRCIPLIITLGTGQIFYGIGLIICGGSFLQFKDKLEFLRKIQLYNFLPLMVIFMLVVVLFVYVLLSRTKFGRRIVAIGGNEKNAYLSGIHVDLYKVITYAISALIVSVAALILGARLNAITATAGSGYETDALVAAIIGGVTFEGGRGTVSGAFLGCLLTGIISNALDILGVNAYVKVVVSGAIVVGAVVLSNISNLRKKH